MTQPQVDQMDIRILMMLTRDARRSSASVARELGISNVAVDRRIKLMLARNIFRTTVYSETKDNDYTHRLVIGLNISDEQLKNAFSALASYSNTIRVSITGGRYNLMATVYFTTSAETAAFISDFLPSLAGIRSEEVFFVVRSRREQGRVQSRMPLDHRDLAIIEALQGNARQSAARLSRRLDLPHSTTRRRLSRLLESRRVLPMTIIPFNLLKPFQADMALKTTPQSRNAVWLYVINHRAVLAYAFLTIGSFDIMTSIYADSEEELNRLFKDDFLAFEGVVSGELMMEYEQSMGHWARPDEYPIARYV